MNKGELIAKVNEKTGMKSEKIINIILETIAETLEKGEKVQLVGFGTFETRDRAARSARNPQDGSTILVAARTVPVFKAGKALKEKINK